MADDQAAYVDDYVHGQSQRGHNEDGLRGNGSQRELSIGKNGSIGHTTTSLKDVFTAFANNNSSFMSSIEFFKLCKYFRIYPVFQNLTHKFLLLGHDQPRRLAAHAHQGLGLLADHPRQALE